MKIEVHMGVEGFDALQSGWNELLHKSATDTLFLTWEWQRAWWHAFGTEKDLRLVAVHDNGGHLNAIIPLFVQETPIDPNLALPDISIEKPLVLPNAAPRRTVHLVGGSEVSDYLDIIAPGGLTRQACAAFLDYLAEEDDWQMLDLRSVPSVSPTISAVAALVGARGWDMQRVREDVCPVLELPDTWDEYLSTRLDKKKRHELRRKMRKAERETRVHWYWLNADSLEQGLAIFFELHRASDPGKDDFMSERMEGFFRAVAGVALERDWLRLAVLRFDGHPVASYLCFDYEGDRLVYNSGFDLSTYRHLSPGVVLLGHLIGDAVQRNCRRFDFLQGSERYKYDLGGTDTEVLRLLITR